jgi:hypothetical protein
MRRASSDAAFPRVVSYSRLDCWLSDNPDDGAVEVNPYAHTNHSNSSNGGMGTGMGTGIGTNSKTNLHTNNSIHSTVVQGPSKSLHRKRTLSNVPRVAHAASYGIAAVTGDSRRVWFRLAWICHFGLLAIVLLVSVLNNPNSRYVTYTSFNDTPTNALFTSNTKSYSHVHRTLGLGDRKYVPIHASDSSGTGDCQKAFVNVMADSLQEPDALICCRNDGLFTGICPSKSTSLPFAGRLAQFPEAWLLPLFPLLFRLLFNLYHAIFSGMPVEFTIFRRLGLYVILMNIRGWVLYLAFNEIEDSIVRETSQACWYRPYLDEAQPDCYGRVFDFSDHVVLYFAQILPIAWLELLYALLESPYWNFNRVLNISATRYNTLDPYYYGSETLIPTYLYPSFLVLSMAYLYFVTFLGTYKTATYFHTGPEVLAGFVVSLTLHGPICYLQCSERCQRVRDYFFGYPKDVR